MDLKARLKHLTKGMAGSANIEQGIEDGTISDKQADFVWNSLNLVALLSIKAQLEESIPDITEALMAAMEHKEENKTEIDLLNHFLDVMNSIKEKVDNTSAGNI
jgi:hypothetical protein